IIEQRVKVNQKAHILELRQRNHEEHCSDNLYAVFIKEDTAYPCPKLQSASMKRISIHRINEEIHVTWAHLEKKRTRLQLYTKSLEQIRIQTVETASRLLVTTSDHIRDGVRKF
ncbi:hypothetical protein Tco_0126288, partial [Tanacetum coccineum]